MSWLVDTAVNSCILDFYMQRRTVFHCESCVAGASSVQDQQEEGCLPVLSADMSGAGCMKRCLHATPSPHLRHTPECSIHSIITQERGRKNVVVTSMKASSSYLILLQSHEWTGSWWTGRRSDVLVCSPIVHHSCSGHSLNACMKRFALGRKEEQIFTLGHRV